MAIYQLCHKLNNLNIDAYIIHHPNSDILSYQELNVKLANEIEDSKDNYIVYPEIYSNLLFNEYGTKCNQIYWLLGTIYATKDASFYQKDIITACQSNHCYEFAKNKKATKAAMLTDYIDPVFFEKIDVPKEDIVVYNPAKISNAVKAVMDERFVPIQNMSAEEVRNLMARAKIYLDLGEMLGKDRAPREAALSNCVVITNRLGPFGDDIDTNLPGEYKIMNYQDAEYVKNFINHCVDNYDECLKQQDCYRDDIRKQEKQFEQEIIKLFGGK
jgi:hypothetical protein